MLGKYLFAGVELPRDPDRLGDIKLAAVLDKLRVQQRAVPTQLVQLQVVNNIIIVLTHDH